jgi:hypothetical protein
MGLYFKIFHRRHGKISMQRQLVTFRMLVAALWSGSFRGELTFESSQDLAPGSPAERLIHNDHQSLSLFPTSR